MSAVNEPVLILQNLTPDGPGYLGAWLAGQGIPFDVFNTEAGDAYPWSIAGYRGLALLGGEMSANDDLPSLRQAERLILQAMDADIPVLGHCLGGQLMARALGAKVIVSPKPEIGWQTLQVADTPLARAWFGDPGERTVYHWHGESFELPAGAALLATNASCPHQAFAIGRHLALQFHVELDAHKLAAWSASADPAFLRLQRQYRTVQSGNVMREQGRTALPAQQQLAARLYRHWLGLAG
ncbi:MAG: type 1 glutamine amidotransferase [Pseudomonadota bacterium]